MNKYGVARFYGSRCKSTSTYNRYFSRPTSQVHHKYRVQQVYISNNLSVGGYINHIIACVFTRPPIVRHVSRIYLSESVCAVVIVTLSSTSHVRGGASLLKDCQRSDAVFRRGICSGLPPSSYLWLNL